MLEVFGLPGGGGYAVGLEGGRVIYVRKGLRPLDPLQARSALLEVLRAQEGAFEFAPGSPPAEGTPLNWPLERLLLSLTNVEDERAVLRPHLPDPRTRFQAVEPEVWLEEPLCSFWERARPWLLKGASGEEVAAALSLELEDVLYYLHKLRLAGKVWPVRAYRKEGADAERKGLLARLLKSLLGRRG